jgi:hypothetical protein
MDITYSGLSIVVKTLWSWCSTPPTRFDLKKLFLSNFPKKQFPAGMYLCTYSRIGKRVRKGFVDINIEISGTFQLGTVLLNVYNSPIL